MAVRSTKDILERRARLMGPNVTTFYDDPVHIVRGEDVWLWDADGNRYLDCYNNVPHVGHANPRVVEAIRAQAATLNTHTRYLHEAILDLLERLTATMDDCLTTGILTCTGSEANDIALRMAEAVTGNCGIIATDYTYHGNTALVSQLSRSNAPGGGFGLGRFFRFVPAPDSYRPMGGQRGAAHAQAFARAIEEQIAAFRADGIGFAALLIDPHFTNEGFPDLDPGWLGPAAEVVQRAGGLLIADEVQPGFGRLGTHFWGHQRQGIVPDIVTMGKPMGNGHPVAAVVSGAGTMAAFRESFRYFNTFGGNPVSCAAALAVLDEIEDRNLMENARAVGAYAKKALINLGDQHPAIGDVRGAGLIFGAELVSDRATRAPAPELARRVVNGLRYDGILISTLGRHGNILKIRPPMPFTESHADLLIETLDRVLSEQSR